MAMSFGLIPQNGLLSQRYRAEIVNTARGEIGVKESPMGSNRGKRIEEYQENRPDLRGEPWCASFVSWIVNTSAKKLGIKSPFEKHYEWVEDIKILAQKKGWLKNAHDAQPQTGDLFIVNGDRPRKEDHIGIVCLAWGIVF